MSLKDFLRKKRSRIVKQWCDIVLETYPEESQSFFKKQKDRFANPVGQTISEGIACVYDELLEEESPRTSRTRTPLGVEGINFREGYNEESFRVAR